MGKFKPRVVYDGAIITSHDMATEKLVRDEFSKIFGYHNACITRLKEKVASGEYTQSDIEALDMHLSLIRGLTRITCVAECALYHESIDFYAIENATLA